MEGGTKQNVNKSNAHHAIIFEAVALALATEADEEILGQAVSLLAKFINVREPNIKYLGLENMVRLAEIPAVNDVISRSAVIPGCLFSQPVLLELISITLHWDCA